MGILHSIVLFNDLILTVFIGFSLFDAIFFFHFVFTNYFPGRLTLFLFFVFFISLFFLNSFLEGAYLSKLLLPLITILRFFSLLGLGEHKILSLLLSKGFDSFIFDQLLLVLQLFVGLFQDHIVQLFGLLLLFLYETFSFFHLLVKGLTDHVLFGDFVLFLLFEIL